jgi:hypothetical protein
MHTIRDESEDSQNESTFLHISLQHLFLRANFFATSLLGAFVIPPLTPPVGIYGSEPDFGFIEVA